MRKKINYGTLTACISVWVTIVSCLGQSESVVSNHYLGNKFIDSLRDEKRIPGMSAAISVKGRIIWEYGSGYSNISTKKKATPLTVYRIASVSKLITTAAIGKLVENKALSFSDDINNYFKISDQYISIAQVLSHTSGIRHYRYHEKVENYPHYKSVTDALEVFIKDSLEFKPGSKQGYSSYGIDLLGAIIEQQSGSTFEKYVENNVLHPLKMHNTFMRPPQTNHRYLSRFYLNDRDTLAAIDLSYNIPGGGMYSTVRDLVNFGDAFLDNGFMDSKIVEKLFTKSKLNNGEEIGYGLGWIVQKLDDGSEMYYHDGHMDGSHAILAIYPKYALSVAILSNRGSNWGVQEALNLSCKVYGLDECPKILTKPEADPQFIMQAFESLSTSFQQFREAIENKDKTLLEDLISDSFKSDEWPKKKEFIDFLTTVEDDYVVFDMDFSIKGLNHGDKAYVKTMRFQNFNSHKSWYLVFTLSNNGQWQMISMAAFD